MGFHKKNMYCKSTKPFLENSLFQNTYKKNTIEILAKYQNMRFIIFNLVLQHKHKILTLINMTDDASYNVRSHIVYKHYLFREDHRVFPFFDPSMVGYELQSVGQNIKLVGKETLQSLSKLL